MSAPKTGDAADELGADLELALELGAIAADVALPAFHGGVASHRKADGSLVTEADLAVERALMEALAAQRPDDAVLSEECGARGQSARRWILDPIDGTSLFASGADAWGTHIALEHDGEVVLGVITRPLRGLSYWASRDAGAFRGELGSATPEARLHVSQIAEPAQARVMIWAFSETPLEAVIRERNVWAEATLDGVLDLVEGRLEAMFDQVSQPWDLAPAIPLVEEAGGRFIDHEGGRRLDRVGGWLTNGHIEPAALTR